MTLGSGAITISLASSAIVVGSRSPQMTSSEGHPKDTTWGNPSTLEDHFHRHGRDFGAKSAEEYARMASEFLRRSRSERLPTKVDAQGVIRVHDPSTNTFGSYNPNGTIRTFYKPNPATHRYPTNLDYWNAQPGVSP
jgi:pyocin large subunit-like protein